MSSSERNPQAAQMADESMVRGLSAQARAVWPQERELLLRRPLPDAPRILDVACGTGEITTRLAELFPAATVTGVDLHEPHLELARERSAALGERVTYERGDAYELAFGDGAFDLVVCRHLLQAVPDFGAVVAELVRVARPGGGVVHVVAEDYGMMHFHSERMGGVDTDDFWRRGPMTFAERTGSDLRSGRKVFGALRRAGLADVTVDYVSIDTERVPRAVFAEIWRAWRDGYAEAIGERTEVTADEARAAFDAMISAIEDEDGFGVWQLPVVSGVRT